MNYCPICQSLVGFSLTTMKDKWHPIDHYRCSNCMAVNRHRLMWLVFDQIKDRISGRVLHCSPMQCLRDRFEQCNFEEYITSDHPPRVAPHGTVSGMSIAEMDIDLCDIPFPDDHFGLLIAIHTIDYIKEDQKAINEIYRVLKPGGIALLIVPIYFDEKTTFTDPPMLQHWWRCGKDYFNKYRKAGFSVEEMMGEDFEDHEIMHLEGEIVTICTKE